MALQKRHMDFGIPKRVSEYDPLSFTIAGEEFECKPAIQGAVLLDFISAADGNDGGKAAAAMKGFFSKCMPQEEYERFYDLIENSDYVFDMEEIAKITSWLVETYSERPKERSTPSRNGRKKAGTTSTADVSSMESV